MNEDTLRWYNENAEAYAEQTVGLDMTPEHEMFLKALPPRAAHACS